MGFTVASYQSGAVHCDYDREILETDIMKSLIIRSLKKRRIYGKYRFHTTCRKPRCKCHSVFFCNPHIIETIWKVFCK